MMMPWQQVAAPVHVGGVGGGVLQGGLRAASLEPGGSQPLQPVCAVPSIMASLLRCTLHTSFPCHMCCYKIDAGDCWTSSGL